jgi:quercetin dioxygenase-like cupin family protein
MFVHEDGRRKLVEFAQGEFHCCKALIAKEGCVVGQHYHRNKDEAFLLLTGRASRVVVGPSLWEDVAAPFVWQVPRGEYHAFYLDPGSVLVGTATEAFDPEDEIKGEP